MSRQPARQKVVFSLIVLTLLMYLLLKFGIPAIGQAQVPPSAHTASLTTDTELASARWMMTQSQVKSLGQQLQIADQRL